MPLEPKIREIAAEFQPGRADFLAALAEFLTRKYRQPVRASDWPPQSLPAHLQPRVEVVDGGNRHWHRAAISERSGRWWRVATCAPVHGRKRHSSGSGPPSPEWSFGDLPESIVVEQVGGAPLLAHPGLELRETAVNVRLFRKLEEAESASSAGMRRLGELAIPRDLSRLRKDLAGLARHIPIPGQQAKTFTTLSTS